MFCFPPCPFRVPQIKQNVKSTESLKRKHNVQSRKSIFVSLSAAYTLIGHEIKCQVDNLQSSMIVSHLLSCPGRQDHYSLAQPILKYLVFLLVVFYWMIETVSPLFSSKVTLSFPLHAESFLFCFFLEVGGGREDWAFQKAYS